MQSNCDDYCRTIHGPIQKPGRRDLAQAAWHLQLMLQGNRVGRFTRDLGKSEAILEYPGSRLIHEYLEQFQFG